MCCLGYVGLWLCFFAGADFGLHAIVGSGFDFLCLLFLGFWFVVALVVLWVLCCLFVLVIGCFIFVVDVIQVLCCGFVFCCCLVAALLMFSVLIVLYMFVVRVLVV